MAGFKKFQREAVAGAIFEKPMAGRLAFLKKVYLTLSIGIGTATLGALLPMAVPSIAQSISNMGFLTMILGIVALLGASFMKKKQPLNLILFYSGTFLLGLSIAPILMMLQFAGLGYLAVEAFGLTTLAFGGLTFYAMTTKKDFSMLNGVLFAGIGILFGLLIMAFFFPIPVLLISAVGILLFSLFILYDTQNVMQVYGEDEYVAAAVTLFLDFFNLFLYILQLLIALSGRD